MDAKWQAYLAAHPDLDALRQREDRPQAWVTCDVCGKRFDRIGLFLDHGQSSMAMLPCSTPTTLGDVRATVCSEACHAAVVAAVADYQRAARR